MCWNSVRLYIQIIELLIIQSSSSISQLLDKSTIVSKWRRNVFSVKLIWAEDSECSLLSCHVNRHLMSYCILQLKVDVQSGSMVQITHLSWKLQRWQYWCMRDKNGLKQRHDHDMMLFELFDKIPLFVNLVSIFPGHLG